MAVLPVDHAQGLPRETPDLLTHRDDRGERVLLGHWNVRDDVQPAVPEGARRLVDVRRLSRIALNAQRQQLIRELRVSQLVTTDERQDVTQDWLARQLRILQKVKCREMLAHHVLGQQPGPILVPKLLVPLANRSDFFVAYRPV